LLLLAAAVTAAVFFGGRRYTRRALMRLIVRAEAVDAAADALIGVVEQIGSATEEDAAAFADDAESVERRALHELHARAAIIVDELDHMPLPKRLVPVAEALSDAAFVVREQSECVGDDDRGQEALERLASVDVEQVQSYREKAHILLGEMCDSCGLDDRAVYGGGLYL
jgi:hypothetical protein